MAVVKLGFDTVWVAQHHFHADEGGLPSLELIAQQVAPALGWAQAPVTGKQAATPPASLESHDRMGSEIGY